MEMQQQKLDELRFDSNGTVILKNNNVKSDILPQKSDEMQRIITIQGNVLIEGAVYGEKILIHDGPVEVKRSIFANNEFHVDTSTKGNLLFWETVASSDTISCMATLATTIFGADVNAKKISLRNAFVGGSVIADEITLDHCIVMGGVFGTNRITIHNSICGTFNSQETNLSGTTYLLYPSAFSVEPIKATEDMKLYNLSITDLMGMFRKQEPKKGTGKILMDLHSDSQRVNMKDDDGSMLLLNSYSVAGRVLVADLINFDSLGNNDLINCASISSQLLKEYTMDDPEGNHIPLSIQNISRFFHSVLDGTIPIPEVDSTIPFEELKAYYQDFSG